MNKTLILALTSLLTMNAFAVDLNCTGRYMAQIAKSDRIVQKDDPEFRFGASSGSYLVGAVAGGTLLTVGLTAAAVGVAVPLVVVIPAVMIGKGIHVRKVHAKSVDYKLALALIQEAHRGRDAMVEAAKNFAPKIKSEDYKTALELYVEKELGGFTYEETAKVIRLLTSYDVSNLIPSVCSQKTVPGFKKFDLLVKENMHLANSY